MAKKPMTWSEWSASQGGVFTISNDDRKQMRKERKENANLETGYSREQILERMRELRSDWNSDIERGADMSRVIGSQGGIEQTYGDYYKRRMDQLQRYLSAAGKSTMQGGSDDAQGVYSAIRGANTFLEDMGTQLDNMPTTSVANSTTQNEEDDPRLMERLRNYLASHQVETPAWLEKAGQLSMSSTVHDEASEEIMRDRWQNRNERQELLRAVEDRKTEDWFAERDAKYGGITSRSDFEQNSQGWEMQTGYAGGVVDNTPEAEAYYNYMYLPEKERDPEVERRLREDYENAGSEISDDALPLTDEQKQIYTYLLNTEGEESARDYYNYISYDINAKKMANAQQAAADQISTTGGKILASAASVPTNLMGGIAGTANILGQQMRNWFGEYRPIDYNDGSQLLSGYSQAVRTEAVDDSNGVDRFLYGTTMSMVDSAVAQFVTRGHGGIVLGMSAAQSAIQDAHERGANDAQALTFGVLSGVFEMAMEQAGFDHLMRGLESGATDSIKNIIKGILSQAGAEGMEEGATTIANTIADLVLMGDKSELAQMVAEYEAAGLDHETAQRRAGWKWFGQLCLDVLGGMVSGGVMSGGGQAINTYGTGRAIQQSGQAQDVLDFSNEYGTDASKALAQRAGTADKATAMQLGRMASVIDSEAYTPYGIDMNTAIEKRVAEIQKERAASSKAQRTAPETAQEASAQTAEEVVEQETKPTQAVSAAANTTQKTAPVIRKIRAKDSKGASVEIVDAVMGQDDVIAFKTADNRVISADELDTTGNPKTLRLVKAAEKLSEEGASGLVSNYDGGDVMPYVRAFTQVYNDARLGRTLEDVRQSVTNLAPEALQAAYRAGNVEYLRDAETGEVRGGIIRNYSGTLSKDQAKTLSVIEQMFKAINRTAEIVDSIDITDEQGNVIRKSGSNAQFDERTNRYKIALDAEDAGMLYVAVHETIHDIEKNAPAEYAILRDMVFDWLKSDGKDIEAMRQTQRELAPGNSNAYYNAEIVANTVPTIFSERETFEAFAEQFMKGDAEQQSAFMRLVDGVLEFLQKVMDVLSGKKSWAQMRTLQKQHDMIAAVRDQYFAALNEATTKDADVLTMETETRQSLKENEKLMVNAEQRNASSGKPVSESVMDQAREDRQEIYDIFTDPERADLLKLPQDIMGNTFFSNSAYGGSEESTTACPRSMAAMSFMDRVAQKIGRPLTVEDTLKVSQEIANWTDKPECFYCYVATDRRAYREFLGEYIKQRDAAIADLRSGMNKEEAYDKFLNGRKPTSQMRKRFDMWANAVKNGSTMITASDLASLEDLQTEIETLRKTKNRTAAQTFRLEQLRDAANYAQSASWAKKMVGYRAYNGHILKWKPARINLLNNHYGLRMYSFSDFSPAFILENMQMFTDAAVRRLKVLAYTKELDFVRIFADTDANINVSVFAYQQNGEIAEDAMQGASWAEAQKLRAEHPNVGITLVATSDEILRWGMEQDWIDVVVPHHLVRTGKDVADYFGYKNYTQESADGKGVDFVRGERTTVYPSEHNNDLVRYVRMLQEYNLTPRFERFLNGYQDFIAGKISEEDFRAMNPNYMKLVNETRRSAEDTPAVQPIFNVDAARESIDEMEKRGGYYQPIGGSIETENELAGEVAGKLDSQAVRYSAKDTDVTAENWQRVLDGSYAIMEDSKRPALHREKLGTDGRVKSRPKKPVKNYRGDGWVREDRALSASENEYVHKVARRIFDGDANDGEYYRTDTRDSYIIPAYSPKVNGVYNTFVSVTVLGRDNILLHEVVRVEGTNNETLMEGIQDEIRSYGRNWDEGRIPLEIVQAVFREEVFIRYTQNFGIEVFRGEDRITGTPGEEIVRGIESERDGSGVRGENEQNQGVIRQSAKDTEVDVETELEQTRTQLADVKKQKAQIQGQYTRHKNADERRKYRERVMRRSNELYQWLANPTEKKHVPASMRATVLQLLRALDMEGRMVTEEPKAPTHPGENATKEQLAAYRARETAYKRRLEAYETKTRVKTSHSMLWATRMEKLADDFMAAEASKEAQLSAFGMLLDPDLADDIKSFAKKYNDVPISSMNATQLRELAQLMGRVKTAVTKTNEMHGKNRGKKVSQVVEQTAKDFRTRKTMANSPLGKLLRSRLYLRQMDAVSFFHMLGDGATTIYDGLRSGFDKFITHVDEAIQASQAALKGVNVKRLTDVKHGIEIETADGKIMMTRAQIMSLYCLDKRDAGKQHLYGDGGGIVSVRDKVQEVHAVTEAQVNAATAKLTEEERKAADALQAFLSTRCTEWGNEATMDMYGYRKFGEEFYFPIKSVRTSYNESDQRQKGDNAALSAIKNRGFTKSLKDNATNPVVIDDILSVYSAHVADMAEYNAYLAPLADAMRWYNWRGSVQEGMAINLRQEWLRAFPDTVKMFGEGKGKGTGNPVEEYFLDFIRRLNGGGSRENDNLPFVRFAKSAAVGLNFSVAIQQGASYGKAMAVLDKKYLDRGRATKKNAQLAEQYCQIAKWKSWGFFQAATGRNVEQLICGDAGVMKQLRDKQGFMAEGMDRATWAKLWGACAAEQRDLHPGMDYNSEEFYRLVGARLSEVIDRTQVVDSVFHRAPVSESKVLSLATAFMSEALKSYGMLAEAEYNYQADKSKANKKRRDRVRAGYVTSQLTAAVLQALVGAWRDKDEEKGDDWAEKFLISVHVLKPTGKYTYGQKLLVRMVENAASNMNPLGLHWLTSKLFDEAMDIFDTGWSSSSTLDVKVLASAAKLIREAAKLDEADPWKYVQYAVETASCATGIGVQNIYKDLIETPIRKWAERKAGYTPDMDEVFLYEAAGESIDDAMSQTLAAEAAEVLAKNPGYSQSKAEREARGNLRGDVTRQYKETYAQAFIDGDEETMDQIEQFMEDSGLYIDGNEPEDAIERWLKDYFKSMYVEAATDEERQEVYDMIVERRVYTRSELRQAIRNWTE